INNLIQTEQTRSVVDEYDAGRVYLAKWATSLDEASRAERSENEPKRWEEETEVGTFEVLNDEITSFPLHAIRTDPLNAERWFSFFDAEGRLKVELNEVREAVFRGGVENDIRIEVWKFFLGMYPWDSSREYWRLKREWWDSPEVLNSDDFKEQKMRIAETLFHQFQRRVEAIDRKRLNIQQENQNSGGSLRRRVGESVVQNGSAGEGSSSDAAGAVDKLPIISELLRDLLDK
ncbi:17639_t:CDS:2, partial [Racocetra fulgida]